MIPAELQTQLDKLAAVLLPQPIYWLSTQEIPPARRMPGTLGYTGIRLDAGLRDVIGDRWEGRRPCVVLDLDQIGPDVRNVLAIGLHEIGHVCERPIDTSPVSPTLDRWAGAEVELSIAFYSAGGDVTPAVPGWLFHDAGWLRIVTHAAYRAENAGIEFAFHNIFPRDNATTPQMHTAWATLHEEFAPLVDVPLMRLREYPIPEAYRRLWLCKVARWREGQPVNDSSADEFARLTLQGLEP